jgi:hypothetical protein
MRLRLSRTLGYTSLVVLSFVMACDRGDTDAPNRDVTSGHRLCIGKQHISIEEGIARQSFTIRLPTTELASRSDIVDVCAAEGGGLVVEYASGLFVRQSINDLARPGEAWEDIVKASPDAGYSLGSMHGYPAIFATPGGPLDLLGLAEWVEPTPDGDIKYKLEGDGTIPLDEIVAAAESMTPVGDGEPTPNASPSAA